MYLNLTFYDLPDEVLYDICFHLPQPKDLAKTRRVSKKWKQIASDNRLWMTHFRNVFRSQEMYLEQHFKLDNDDMLVEANDNSNPTEKGILLFSQIMFRSKCQNRLVPSF